jgi:two-component sensor histidine kinase
MQAQLINDLLDVSRVSKGKLHLQMRLVDFRTVIEDVVESIDEPMQQKRLALQLDLESACVAGDAARLQQIVTNLMMNAVQFTPGDGHMVVRLRSDGAEAVLTVEDSGAGIDPSFLPFVFDQFRQGEGVLTRKHGGLGLGLTVVQQLVELHGGSVTVSSPGVGKGSRFTVRLPRENGKMCDHHAEEPLLLSDLRIRLDLANDLEAETLRAVLESSGASVRCDDDEAAASDDYDILVRDDPGGALLSFTRRGTEEATIVPKSTPQGELVRRFSRAFADTTVP